MKKFFTNLISGFKNRLHNNVEMQAALNPEEKQLSVTTPPCSKESDSFSTILQDYAEINRAFERCDTDYQENRYYLAHIRRIYAQQMLKDHRISAREINSILADLDHDRQEQAMYIQNIHEYYARMEDAFETLAEFYQIEYGGEEIGGYFGEDYFRVLERDQDERDAGY